MKLFNFDIHIGKWRVLVQTRDIADKAVTGSKILDRVIDWFHIKKKAIRNEHIDDGAVDARTIKKGAVKNEHIGKAEIHPDKFAPCVEEWINEKMNYKCRLMEKQMRELRQLVTSYTKNGIALSNNLGAGQDIGVTQWKIAKELGYIWKKLNDITGEPGKGIHVGIDPKVFITDGTALVNITVMSDYEEFESLKIYVNDELRVSREHTEGFIDTMEISETSCIRTVAMIQGMEYTDIQIVNKLFPFFIGSGEIWSDAMTQKNARQYNGHLRGSYDITVNEDGQKMFVIIPTYLKEQMIRIDMNGFEVPVTVNEHDQYTVYESTNTYRAGRYNIDITNNCRCKCEDKEQETEE